jgi:hypothetical protein
MAENGEKTASRGPGRPFAPGQSGNPGGRPKLTPRALEVRAACREASVRAVERLTELLESDDPAVVLRAAAIIFDRAWGAPGSEADVRETDMARVHAAQEREHPDTRTGLDAELARLNEPRQPPPDVD